MPGEVPYQNWGDPLRLNGTFARVTSRVGMDDGEDGHHDPILRRMKASLRPTVRRRPARRNAEGSGRRDVRLLNPVAVNRAPSWQMIDSVVSAEGIEPST